MIEALSEFGVPTANIQPCECTEPEMFFQIGAEPVRIDILSSVTGLDFESAWERRITADFGGESAPVLSRADILAAKACRRKNTVALKPEFWRTFPSISVHHPTRMRVDPIIALREQ
jgi:hypothetical protein